MSNINAKIEKQGNVDVLVVTTPLSVGPSQSGKTTVVASTRGNQPTTAVYNGQPVTIGLNAYVRK